MNKKTAEVLTPKERKYIQARVQGKSKRSAGLIAGAKTPIAADQYANRLSIRNPKDIPKLDYRHLTIEQEERLDWSWVYVLETKGAYKVGISKNPDQRHQSIQVGCPFEVRFVYARQLEFAKTTERALHEYLEDCKIRGEWYLLSAQQVDDVINKIEGIDEQEIARKIKQEVIR